MANPLESFKKLPTWGKFAVAGGGLVAVLLVVRAHQAAASAAAGTTAIDPQTGDPVGSAADQAELAAMQGGGASGGGTVGGGTAIGTTSGYANLSAWAQAAQAGLAEVGFDPQAVATALGAYLGGQQLTADQAGIVNAAKSEFDTQGLVLPPVVLASSTGPASSGNTTTTGTGTSTGTSTTGTTGTTGTGTGTGSTTAAAPAQATVSGGHVISHNNNDVEVGWTGHNAVKYLVVLTFPGTENGRSNTIAGTTASYSGLPSGHTGHVTVTPYNSAGVAGPPGTIDISTT